MYCSPIADTLLTVAVTFSGTGVFGVEPHAGDDAVVGEPDGLDPADGHAAVGDVGVLVEAAAGDEVRGDVVRADAERRRDVEVERRDGADAEHRDDREDRQLDAGEPVSSATAPRAGLRCQAGS